MAIDAGVNKYSWKMGSIRWALIDLSKQDNLKAKGYTPLEWEQEESRIEGIKHLRN